MNLQELYEIEGGPLMAVYTKGEYSEEEFRTAAKEYYNFNRLYYEWFDDQSKVYAELWRNVPYSGGGMQIVKAYSPGKGVYKVTVMYTGRYN
jgi:hypothetical protein